MAQVEYVYSYHAEIIKGKEVLFLKILHEYYTETKNFKGLRGHGVREDRTVRTAPRKITKKLSLSKFALRGVFYLAHTTFRKRLKFYVSEYLLHANYTEMKNATRMNRFTARFFIRTDARADGTVLLCLRAFINKKPVVCSLDGPPCPCGSPMPKCRRWSGSITPMN